MPKPRKPYKPPWKSYDYVDYKRRLSITHDELQWIIDRNSSNTYHGKLSDALKNLFEEEVRDLVGIEKETLLQAIEGSLKRIEHITASLEGVLHG